jgi:hypothetical protein
MRHSRTTLTRHPTHPPLYYTYKDQCQLYACIKGQHLAKPSHILTAIIMTCLAMKNSLPGRRPTRNVSAFKKTAEMRITETLLFKVSFFHAVFTSPLS